MTVTQVWGLNVLSLVCSLIILSLNLSGIRSFLKIDRPKIRKRTSKGIYFLSEMKLSNKITIKGI